MKVHAVITAAGSSRRMGSVDKLLLELHGEPLLVRTLRPFLDYSRIGRLVVAVNPERVEEFSELFTHYFGPERLITTAGGSHRQESILHALRALSKAGAADHEPVLVHDGARPFVSADLFELLLIALEDYEGVIPAAPVRDTVKRVNGSAVLGTEDRETLRLVQTPQAFTFSLLRRLHEQAAQEGFIGTDDASLLERYGHSVGWVDGPVTNLKVTVPEDLVMLGFLAQQVAQRQSR